MHCVKCRDRVAERFAFGCARRRSSDIHHVGTKALARELEGTSCSRGRLEEDIQDRSSPKGGDLSDWPASNRQECLGRVQDSRGGRLVELLDPKKMSKSVAVHRVVPSGLGGGGMMVGVV